MLIHKLRIQSQRDTEIRRSATDVKVKAFVAARPRTHKEEEEKKREDVFHSQIRSQSSDKGTRKGAPLPRLTSTAAHELNPAAALLLMQPSVFTPCPATIYRLSQRHWIRSVTCSASLQSECLRSRMKFKKTIRDTRKRKHARMTA